MCFLWFLRIGISGGFGFVGRGVWYCVEAASVGQMRVGSGAVRGVLASERTGSA